MAVTHHHWTVFPPVHPFIQHVVGIIFFCLWIVSCVANGLVVFVFLK